MHRIHRSHWRILAALLCLAGLVALVVAVPNPLRRTVRQVSAPLLAAGTTPPHFGCDPGPSKPAPPQNELDPIRPVALISDATLLVDGRLAGRPIAGVGFNIEPTLWTCPAARPLIEQRIFDTFHPDLVRVGLAQAPWAPEDADSVDDLTWDAYQRVLDSPAFQPSWDFIAMLNQRGITPIVAPWGVPGLLTENGEPTGTLKPEYFEKYAEYYAAAIDYLVNRRGLKIGPASVMNEPDCGDGSHISPRDFPKVARLVGERLAQYGVKLYGPDTCNADSATHYLDYLLRDGQALEYFAVIGTHQYAPGGEVAELLREMREGGLSLPLYVTEYTTYRYGNLDDGQEAPAEMPYLLEIASVLQSHLTSGADAALYWDAVDYYWLLHDAISKWGVLRGPQVDPPLTPRKHYYGLLQILPYFPAGAQIISTSQRGPTTLLPLAVERPGDGALSIVLINRGRELNLEIDLEHLAAPATRFHVYRTSADEDRADLGEVAVEDDQVRLTVAPRSITTLAAP
ncbi:MAG TPA: glycosyl hydrolase [Chloroflexota bacterium]|nr:glycosyl hydrolase [Chloroflexota bacterium]